MSESDRSISTERVDAKFIEGPNGRLFCIIASSESTGSSNSVITRNGRLQRNDEMSEVRDGHTVLFIPPFGEEINLCRRFYSLLRARLSSAGLQSVQPDLYGTGDSAGCFEEATWEMWQSDLEYVIDRFCLAKEDNEAGKTLSIVAVRAGCLLSQQILSSSIFRECNAELKNIVFIRPEFNGYDIINRLLRARITAQRFSGNKTQTTADLWARIESGETVHAGGHALSAELCRVLKSTHLELGTPTRFGRQVLFAPETSTDNHESPGWERFSMTEKPFWLSYDTEPETALINAIAEILDSGYDCI